jgi:uncharacterized protein
MSAERSRGDGRPRGAGPGDGRYLRRGYRERMGGRFRSFAASYKESDLWIGVDPGSYSERMEDFAATEARRKRLELEAYIAQRPEFASSLAPIADDPAAPAIARAMLRAAGSAGVGPMAAVAGAMAEAVGRALQAEFGCREVVVENGGDLWLAFVESIDVSVFAGESPLSERVGVSIPPEFSPLGLCTSSGTVGPSLSLGRADAAMVACADAATADAWATSFGNAVGGPDEIATALRLFEGEGGADAASDTGGAGSRAGGESRTGLLSVLLIAGDRMGIRGILPLKMFAPGS